MTIDVERGSSIVTVTAGAASLTVSSTDAEADPDVAVIVTAPVPEAAAVTRPVLSTVASASFEDVHVRADPSEAEPVS